MKLLIVLTALGAGFAAAAAGPDLTARITPSEIELGQTSNLTITASGKDPERVAAPDVPGLSFMVVGQSRRIESVNGVMTSSFSVTYQVTAHHAGTYVIASIAPGIAPLMLKVDEPGTAAAGSAAPGGAAAGTAAPGASAPDAPATVQRGEGRASADPGAIVKLIVPTREIYVGQSVPVEIEVDTRDGVVASLNGLPALNGDAFTLDKLSAEPERRSEAVIDGKPYTVFTWHSVLSAIKPGALSVSLETPMTVRVPVQRPSARFLDDSTLEDVFDDPAFQGFFGGSAEKEVTVSSTPVQFNVLDLPARDKPADFSGAVGDFKVSSKVSEPTVSAGDPVTLRMTVSGEGNFDRVDSTMLRDAAAWKTYKPTAKFISADKTSYRGEKVFEQPVVATAPGRQILPSLSFSYFNPTSRRYETARTEPLTVDVAAAPAAGEAATAAARAPGVAPGVAPSSSERRRDELRPDKPPQSGIPRSLVPLYFRAPFLAVPVAMLLVVPGGWLWLRRRERRAAADMHDGPEASGDPQRLMAAMDRASEAGNAEDFFRAARALLQRVFASRWQIPPDAVTLAEVDTRLGPESEVRRLFALADEVRYSQRRVVRLDLRDWKRIVLGQMPRETAT